MSLKNNLFTLLFMASFLFSGLNSAVEVNSSSVFIPTSLNGVRLLHDENGFAIEKNGDVFPVKTECMDKELVNLSDEELDFLLGLKAKIEIDGEEQIITRISPELTRKLMAESQKVVPLSPEDSEKIISQLPASSYIKVFQYSDGEYGLHLKTRLPGGGLFGASAGCWIGKFVASAVCHTAIFVVGGAVSLVATPAVGAIVIASLETTLAAPIEVVTTAAAVAGGITLAVATGPV